MEIDKLKDFIRFMDDNNLVELEIEEDGKRIKLKKNVSEHPVVMQQNQAPIAADEEASKNHNNIEIKSPMVGTFYRTPAPGTKSYVEIGDVISAGDVVCIVEAMKLMNEIKSEVEGKIIQIPVENGEPVEFGQTLFAIEPL